MKSNLIYVAAYFLVLAGFSACKKTEDLPKQSTNKIVAYKVPVAEGTISGAIDESDKTITVYLPFYYQLDVIDPQITLQEGAKLQEEVVPVAVLNDSTTYTVIGPDQSTATYKLIINLQQISPLEITEVSDKDYTANWGIGASTIQVSGNFNTNDAAKITAYLIDSENNETPLLPNTGYGAASVGVNMVGDQKIYTFGYLQVPQALDTGEYKLKVKVQALTAETEYPIKLVYQQPSIDYATVSVKGGDTFTIKTSGNVFHDFQEFSITVNNEQILLPIESYTRTEAVIRVPASVPPGQYYPRILFGGFDAYNANWPITVTAE